MKLSLSKRIAVLAFLLALSFAVRVLTANFLRAHFNDPAWFQFGSYAVFDRQAQAVLDGRQSLFWISDSSRTDLIVYPPGNVAFISAIYGMTRQRSPLSVQSVQLVLDALSVLLIVGIGTTAYRWSVGITAGVLAALSPLLAFAGITPGVDAPTSWLVLAALWCLLLTAKHRTKTHAIATGVLLGLACWMRVNPLFLFVPWAALLFLIIKSPRRERSILSASLVLTTLVVISPIVVRNLVVFYPQVAPTGLSVGWNLLAGIGETERGAEFGAPCCDDQMIAQDRQAMNLSPEAPLELHYPDGIRRDRDRASRALAIIESHPFWFAGVMGRRIWGHLKFAGRPAPHVGTTGINVTSDKCLSENYQQGLLALTVNILGMIQSVFRFVALPLMIFGVCFAFRANRVSTLLLLSTIVYYLATLAVGHSEIRYGLPMQATLIVFAAVALCSLPRLVERFSARLAT